MALHLHRADRTDLLAEGLGALLSEPLADPFAEELVLVSARGMERWLSQRLSHVLGRGTGADGVCAGVSFRSPASLIAEITGTVDDDPWSPEAMTWPLLEVIDASCDDDWCRTLATHLGHFDVDPDEAELRRGRRYAVARRLAGLFASYARQRPQMLVDWLDGRVADLDGDLHWQPNLWRALVARVDAEPPHLRHAATLERLRDGPTDLPERISLFGHTRLPSTDIELLDAVSTHHDLHLWLPHPSDDLWRALRDVHYTVPRSADTTRHRAVHPLLDTLGRDVRELQRSLPTADHDEFVGAATRPNTLLGWLQSDIAANEPRPGARLLTPDDRSVQVHSCHGDARQIDVLREVLLGLLADDDSLEPRDILVMCPDIETYAPLIVAAFGLGGVDGAGEHGHPAHQLRVRLADRSLVQTNPLLGVAAHLLDIAGTRASASQVLNLAQSPPVRSRFGFTDDDLDAIAQWVRQSGIRWGFDAAHRGPYRLDHVAQNTWRFGLDRILTGVAMSDDAHAWIDTALPLDDVGSDRVDVAGRFADYVERLSSVVTRLTDARPLTEWLDTVRAGVDDLTRIATPDAWQAGQLQREFAKVLSEAGIRGNSVMRLSDVRSLLAGHLAGRPTRANFRTGTLTVCSLVPMRSVPHRVVCLVGLDDGVFPRIDLVDGDDALARRPLTGERDIRSEDRQLLLDAICAATENLVITYTGTDEHTGARRPPAVPLQELLDALDTTTPDEIRGQIVVNHPLQPFDIKNVERGALIREQPFTFDPVVLRAARTAAGERAQPRPFISGRLAESLHHDVELADLLRFFKHPVEGFFRELDVTLPWEVDGIDDAMPVDIDALAQWSIGDRLVNDLMRGVDLETATTAERLRGMLPPGRLGARKAAELSDQAAELAMAALRYQSTTTTARDLDVHLGDGRRLTGTVSPIYRRGIVSVTYSRLAPKHILQSWISLAALGAAGYECGAACIGRGDKGDVKARVFAVPSDPISVLRDLLAIFDAGRCEPLPLPLKTSYAWAERRRRNRPPVAYARTKWEDGVGAENDDRAHVRIWGADTKLDDLLTRVPRPGEEVDGEDTRLGALAVRLWLPVLDAEVRVG